MVVAHFIRTGRVCYRRSFPFSGLCRDWSENLYAHHGHDPSLYGVHFLVFIGRSPFSRELDWDDGHPAGNQYGCIEAGEQSIKRDYPDQAPTYGVLLPWEERLGKRQVLF